MLLSLNDIGKHFGTDEIIDQVTLSVDEGAHIGLIGSNGSGKSTLLKMIIGILEPDNGNITYKNDLTIGYLHQDLGLDDSCTIMEEALKASAKLIQAEAYLQSLLKEIEQTEDLDLLSKLNEEYFNKAESFEAEKGYYYRSITIGTLKGLGFEEDAFSQPIKQLSGGQKMRVALAKLLISEPDLLLLDEPTNYLDLDSIRWLESYLIQYKGTYIIVSHDRYFLEKTVSTIWEVEDHEVKAYNGNYSAYYKQKQEYIHAYERAYKQQQKYIKRQQEIITKLKSFNREKSIRQAESREKQLAKIDTIEKRSRKKTAKINFKDKGSITNKAIEFQNLSVGYNNKPLIEGIDMIVHTGETIGICGDNATGKSTILKTIMGQLQPVSGTFLLGSNIKPTHFKQQHEDLDPNNSILEELTEYSGEDNGTIRNILGSLLFSAEDVHKKIGVLSGGEVSRVAVAKLMLNKSNLMLLDEPTNHLDITSKDIFETALKSYSGTIILVSHDRYLLNTIADRMIFIHKGKAYMYDCGYEKANELFNQELFSTEDKVEQNSEEGDKEQQNEKQLSKNAIKKYTERITEIEELLLSIQQEKEQIEAEMSEESFFKNAEYARERTIRHQNLAEKHDRLEEEWVELHYLLENKV